MSELVHHFFEHKELAALDEIVRRWMPRMRGIARRMLRSRKVPPVQYEADEAVDSALGCIIAAVTRGTSRWVPDPDGFWALVREGSKQPIDNGPVDSRRAATSADHTAANVT